tara:strand:- start:32 stop:487 length:456 start_codon:yes stop_codon:yes gene_type:complete
MLKSFLSIFRTDEHNKSDYSCREGILEISSIFIRVGKLDNHLDKIEIETIKELLFKRFNIEKDKLDLILKEAEEHESNINDNVQLTRKIKNFINYEERYELLKDTWKIILSDKVKSQEEESYMRLLCKLLGLSDKDNALARKEIIQSNENK